MINHDQLFKDLFRSSFRDLLSLADADPKARLAKALGPGDIKFLDKEVFQDFPEGRRRPGRIGRARLKIELLRKIATAAIGEAERFLLTNCVETYLQLTGREAKEYVELRRTQENPEIEAMEMTWADRIGAQYLQKGREEGLERGAELLRHTVLRQLGQRFGEVSPKVRKRIEAIGSLDELGGLADRILEVESIEELGLGN